MNMIMQFGSTNSSMIRPLRELFKKQPEASFFKTVLKTIDSAVEYAGKEELCDILGGNFALREWLYEECEPGPFLAEHSLVAITLAHIYHLCLLYAIRTGKISGNEKLTPVTSIGHSIGLLSAVISAAPQSDIDSFLNLCRSSICYTFMVLFRCHQTMKEYALHTAASHDTSRAFNPTPMAFITGIDYSQLEKMIQAYNKLQHRFLLEIGLDNGMNDYVITGHPEDIEKFFIHNNNQLTASGVKYGYLKCTLPFHSSILYSAIIPFEKDRNFIDLKLTGPELVFPVINTFSGKNLQESDDLYMDIFKTVICSRLNWYQTILLSVIRTSSQKIIDFGPTSAVRHFTRKCIAALNYPVDITQLNHNAVYGLS